MFMNPLPEKKKDDQDASDKKSKRGKRKSKKPSNEATKSIDIRYRGNDSRKPQSQAQCSLTLGQGGNVWNPTGNAAESLFPDVEAVVNEQLTEQEMFEQAIIESMATLQEKCMIDAIPDDEAIEKFARNSDDEDTWGRVQRNLPTPEPAKDAKASDANNNSGSLGPIENLTVPTVKLQTRHSEIISRKIGNEPLVPSVTTTFIDKYGRVDGYTEKHLFMGRGARFKQEEYLKQQQLLRSINSCSDVQDSHRDSASSANSCQDLRASAQNSDRQTTETMNASAVQDFIDIAAQTLQANATNGAISQDPAIITMQFPRESEEMPDQNFAEPSEEFPKESEESSVSSHQFDDAAEQFSAPEASPVAQESVRPPMEVSTLTVEVQEFFPKNYIHPTVQSAEFPESSQSSAGLVNQSANFPEQARDSLLQDFESQTRQIATSVSARRDSGATETSTAFAGHSNGHQGPGRPNAGQSGNRGGYHEGDRNSSRSARESSGGFDSKSKQSVGKNYGRGNRNSYGGSRGGDCGSNRPYENSYREDHRVVRHEQNPYKYENSYREDHRVARHEQNPYKYEHPNREDHRGVRQEQNPHKNAGPNRNGQRSAKPEQNQRYDGRDGQQGPRGQENREVQRGPPDHMNRHVQGRPTDQQNREVQRGPMDQQNRHVQGRPTDQQNREVQRGPMDQQNRHVQGRPNEQNRGAVPRSAIPQNRGIPWGSTEQNPPKHSEGALANSSNNYARVVSQNVQQSNVSTATASGEKPPIQQPKIAESREKFEGSVAPGEAKEPCEAANVSVTEPPPFSSFNSRHTTTQIHELATELPPTPSILMSPMEMATPVHPTTIPPPNPAAAPLFVSQMDMATPPVHSALIPPPNPSAAPLFASPIEMTMPPVYPAVIPPSEPPALTQLPRHSETNGVTMDPPLILPSFSLPPPGFHPPARPASQSCANCANRAAYEAAESLASRHASLRLNDPLLYKLLVEQRELDPRLMEFLQNASKAPSKQPHCSCKSQLPENPPEPSVIQTGNHERAEDPDGQAQWCRSQNVQRAANSCPPLPTGATPFPEAASAHLQGRSDSGAGKQPYSIDPHHENSLTAAFGVDPSNMTWVCAPRDVDPFNENPPFASRSVDNFHGNSPFPFARSVDSFPEGLALACQPPFPVSQPYGGFPLSSNASPPRFGHSILGPLPPEMQRMQMQQRWLHQQLAIAAMCPAYGDEFMRHVKHFQQQHQPSPLELEHSSDTVATSRCNVHTGNPEANHQPPPPVFSALYPENPPPAAQSEVSRAPRVTPMAIVGRGRGRLDAMRQKK